MVAGAEPYHYFKEVRKILKLISSKKKPHLSFPYTWISLGEARHSVEEIVGLLFRFSLTWTTHEFC